MKKVFRIISVSLLIFGFFSFWCNFSKAAGTLDVCDPCCPATDGCKSSLTCVPPAGTCDLVKNAGQCLDPNQVSFCPVSSHTEVKQLVDKVSNEILYLALIIAPLLILLGAFYMLTAAGEPARSTKGKTIITWALIGLAVILAAKAFISIITSVIK